MCQVDKVASPRGSLGIQHSAVAAAVVRVRGHVCAFVCYLHVSFVMRARFTRTGSFVVLIPIWLKLLFVHVVLLC